MTRLVMVSGKSVLDLAVIWDSQLQGNWMNLFELGIHFGKKKLCRSPFSFFSFVLLTGQKKHLSSEALKLVLQKY